MTAVPGVGEVVEHVVQRRWVPAGEGEENVGIFEETVQVHAEDVGAGVAEPVGER